MALPRGLWAGLAGYYSSIAKGGSWVHVMKVVHRVVFHINTRWTRCSLACNLDELFVPH